MSSGGRAGSKGQKNADEVVVQLDPDVIYFTFSRIRPRFSCGRTIQSTIDQLVRHELTPHDMPLLSVLTDGTHYYSQNNRRLYTFKRLKALGTLTVVPVRLRSLPNTRRMAERYTPDKCSLTATIMGGGGGGNCRSGPKATGLDNADKEEYNDNEDEEEKQNGSYAKLTDPTCAYAANGAKSEQNESPSLVTGWGDVSLRNVRQRRNVGLGDAPGYQYGRVDSLTSEGNIPRSGIGYTELHDDTNSGGIRCLRLVEITNSSSSNSDEGGGLCYKNAGNDEGERRTKAKNNSASGEHKDASAPAMNPRGRRRKRKMPRRESHKEQGRDEDSNTAAPASTPPPPPPTAAQQGERRKGNKGKWKGGRRSVSSSSSDGGGRKAGGDLEAELRELGLQ